MLIKYEVGDLFLSKADCLVNTVNCEGYMGKGVAYQFKMKFPENNKDYIKACKSGALHIGTLHFYQEDGVTIINFPTKDRWREKSRMNYIEIGLEKMVQLLPELSVKSVAIPPLGCGNGGLNWQEVKQIIEEKLSPLQDQYSFIVYEPSRNYVQKTKAAPKLGFSSLILMKLGMNLNRRTSLRLQNAAYFMDIFLKEHYFKFQKYKYGPYAHSISIVAKDIGEYQNYYGLNNTKETYDKVFQVLCSDKTDRQLGKMEPAIDRSVEFVNSFEVDKELEGVSTVLYLIESNNGILNQDNIIQQFKAWSEDKSEHFSKDDIIKYIGLLEDKQIIEEDILKNYRISEYI